MFLFPSKTERSFFFYFGDLRHDTTLLSCELKCSPWGGVRLSLPPVLGISHKLHCRTCFKNHSEQDYSFFTPILKQWEQLPTTLLTKHYMPITLYEELDRCPLSSMCLRGLETHTTADKPNVYITKSVSVHVFDRDLAFCPIFPFYSALKGTCFFHQSWEEGRKSW